MRWASTASLQPGLEAAVDEATSTLRGRLDEGAPDLVVAFVSAHHTASFNRVPELIRARLPSRVLIGCSGGGIIGGGKEVEQHPGVSLTAAVLPDVQLIPFHLDGGDVSPGNAAELPPRLGVIATQVPHFVLLADPYSFDPEPLLHGLDGTYPSSRTIGGLASGGQQPGDNALFLGPTVHRSGAVGVALTGDIEVDTIVAQGCRPIGLPMFVTSCQSNVIRELDGRSAVEVLQEVFNGLSGADQELARRSLFLGVAMTGDRREYHQGDFLIRNLVGMDPARGALAIGAIVQNNAIVQFHLRDAQTSAQDLEQMLTRYSAGHAATVPAGGLLFSCLGRGKYLYGHADHDTNALRRHLGDLPLGGFFCNGEIGPVHGTTFLHGYTSAFGLFRRRTA